jgi:hypothetical protein
VCPDRGLFYAQRRNKDPPHRRPRRHESSISSAVPATPHQTTFTPHVFECTSCFTKGNRGGGNKWANCESSSQNLQGTSVRASRSPVAPIHPGLRIDNSSSTLYEILHNPKEILESGNKAFVLVPVSYLSFVSTAPHATPI